MEGVTKVKTHPLEKGLPRTYTIGQPSKYK